jgi:flagellar biosynthesis protein
MSTKYFKAAALSLNAIPGSAPYLAACGEHEIANYIVECARKFGIPVVEKPELCDALSELEIEEEIPPELYEIAAAVLQEVGALIKRS